MADQCTEKIQHPGDNSSEVCLQIQLNANVAVRHNVTQIFQIVTVMCFDFYLQ